MKKEPEQNLQKRQFSAFSARKNRAPSHFGHCHFASLCQKSEKTNELISRKVGNRQTDERTNKRTKVNLYRTSTVGPKSKFLIQIFLENTFSTLPTLINENFIIILPTDRPTHVFVTICPQNNKLNWSCLINDRWTKKSFKSK